MQITHLGHAAVLVEIAEQRILIDPGNFSDGWHDLTGLDAILITHAHPDHLDPEHAAALVAANPDAVVRGERGALAAVELAGASVIEVGEQHSLGDVTIAAVGGHHAIIHADIPAIGNVGFVISAPGDATFFHPGDELDTAPAGVDVLAIPAYGPWAAMKETIDFVREVGAAQGFLIHEGLLAERGKALIASRVPELTSTELVQRPVGEAWVVGQEL